MFSLSMVVSTALDYEEKREVSESLNSLLAQMESKDVNKRPTLATIIKVHNISCFINLVFCSFLQNVWRLCLLIALQMMS